jgi:hypothetical protein
MITFGSHPVLECSSRGDRRFSAFFARIKWRNNKSIEEIYQGYKLFPGMIQGLSIKEAKGKTPINIEACRKLYSQLWDEFFLENPELLLVIKEYNGFSDIFGQPGRACQAEEIYRIRQSI